MKAQSHLNVATLPVTDLKNIATQLRIQADWVESQPEPITCILIFGRASQKVDIFGYGHRASGLEVQGWLARAVAAVAKMCNPDD
jgi:hypothetical protein